MNENEFKNVFNSTKTYKSHSFKQNVAVPFLSGALGCALVIRNLFWSSYNKRKNCWKYL